MSVVLVAGLGFVGIGCEFTGAPLGGCDPATTCVGAPTLVSGLPALTQLEAGAWRSCGISTEGDAWCWGDVASGGAGSPAPALVPGGLRFVRIAVGRFHNCALTADSAAYCWAGRPDDVDGWTCGPTECGVQPVRVGTQQFRALTVESNHTCALDLSGAAFCWGFNYMGETGSDRYETFERDLVAVPGGLTFTAIESGRYFTCGLTTGGAVHCWGWGDGGQLGRLEVPVCKSGPLVGLVEICSFNPLPVTAPSPLHGLTAGMMHACAIGESSRAICWGDNGQGQLGRRGFGSGTPAAMASDSTWSLLEAGGATCGIATSGGTYCWGGNAWGLLGTGTRVDVSATPLPVAGGHSFVALAAGYQHICALTSTGSAYCWGDNGMRQLGQ